MFKEEINTQPIQAKTGKMDGNSIIIQVVSLIRAGLATPHLMSEIVDLLARWTGFEAVGLRLREGDCYPYLQTVGMSEEFLRLENTLCLKEEERPQDPLAGAVPTHECACGQVLLNRVDRSQPFISEYGSFWTKSVSELFAQIPELQNSVRGVCVRSGYESAALVPIRMGNETFGLIQIEDKRPGLLSEDLLSALETIATSLALALSYREHVEELQVEKKNLTERVEVADTSLWESHGKYRYLFESIADAVAIVDLDGRIQDSNSSFQAMLGYTGEELLGKHYSEFTPERWHAGDAQIIEQQVLLRGSSDVYEKEYVRKDGTVFPVEMRIFLIRNRQGQPEGRLAIVRDITKRKQVEEELYDQKERLALAMQSAQLGIFDLDMLTGRAVWTQQCESMMGYPPTESGLRSYKEWTDRVHPEDLPLAEESIRRAVAEKTPFQTEYRVVWPNGSIHWVEAQGVLTYDSGGRPTRLLGSVRDISEHKRSQAALLESEALFRRIFEYHAAVKLIIDPDDGSIIDANQAAEDFYGWPKERLTQMKIQDINVLSPTEIDQEMERAKNLDRVHFEFQHRLADGSIRDVEVYSSKIEVKGRHLLHSIVHDVTERKHAEAEREKLQEQLNQAQKMESIGRLAGGVAHDFNNMLGIIIGHAEMVLDQLSPGEQFYEDLQNIRKAADRSAALTRQLLAFARKQNVTPEVLNLNETVEGMLKMLRRLIGEDIDLVWQPGPDLHQVKIDPSQIDQILANLCVNARDAIRGVGKLTIETGNVVLDEAYCAKHVGFFPGDYAMIAVSDDGSGIPKDFLDKIFEPFFTTKAFGEGTGLGLATVYGIVKQNSGFINVYSEPGKGTTFKIYLPRYKHKAERLQEIRATTTLATGSETILLVEDEKGILNMATMLLERLGYTVLTANTPGEAIHIAEEYPAKIDLLITDVIMPEMNGRELAKRILTLYPDIKRLFMSGYTANVIAHHGVLDASVNFLQKPFTLKELSTKLRQALGKEGE